MKQEVIVLDDSDSETEKGSRAPASEVLEETPLQKRRRLMAQALDRRLNPQPDTVETTPKETVKAEPKSESITLDDDDIEELVTPQYDARHEKLRSPVRLFTNPSLKGGNKDTISLKDLLGSPSLEESYQFNFMIDMAFLTKFVSHSKVKFTTINQQGEFLNIPDDLWEKYQIHSIDASRLLSKYGSHHTKMMINFLKTGCQIVIHTMNLTEADYLIQTQMAWVSPVLPFKPSVRNDIKGQIDETDTGLAFKRDLFTYLSKYEDPDINLLINKLSEYDFSEIDVVFIGSAPGQYKYYDKEKLKIPNSPPAFGYARLWQIIQQNNLSSLDGSLLSQVSSISGPFDGYKRNILVHLLTSCVENGYPFAKKSDYEFVRGKGKVEPMIIWPTIKEVLSSLGAELSGRALFYTNEGNWASYKRQAEVIDRYLYKWKSSPSNDKTCRGSISPHCKTYCLSEDRFKSLKWFMVTSANLSHHAWGKPAKFDRERPSLLNFEIGSFETGVVVVPRLVRGGTGDKLIPVYDSDTIDGNTLKERHRTEIPIRVPYTFPLAKYGPEDKPWARPGIERYFQ